MKTETNQHDVFKQQIENFLNECMLSMYNGHDHIVARKYYRDLFNELIPKYFCICEEKGTEMNSAVTNQ